MNNNIGGYTPRPKSKKELEERKREKALKAQKAAEAIRDNKLLWMQQNLKKISAELNKAKSYSEEYNKKLYQDIKNSEAAAATEGEGDNPTGHFGISYYA